MSESIPKIILTTIIGALRENPHTYQLQVSNYLPLLYDYLETYIVKDKIIFAYFKKSLMESWVSVIKDIPPPSLEGVYDLDSLMNKMIEHIYVYEKQLTKILKIEGITSAFEKKQALRDLLNKVVFQAVLDTLMILVPL